MSCLHYKEDVLYIEELALDVIAAQFSSPCYVYSKKALLDNWRSFNQGLADLPHQLCYAVKANSNLAILNILAKQGAGFDIVSIGELKRVLAAGGQAEKIVFSGVGKSSAEIREALICGIYCFNVESIAELSRIHDIAHQHHKIASIALRVNPDINPNTHEYISTGLKENKFGIDLNDIMPICQQINNYPNVNLIGIACHIGSQITSLEPFRAAIDCMLALYHQLQSMNIKLQHIDIGGGLGINYQQEDIPSINDYTKILHDKFSSLPLKLLLEPGRSMVGNVGVLLTQVEYLKHNQHKNFAIVDAGMNDLLRPALYQAWQNVLPVKKRKGNEKKYDIVGPVCESADFLAKDRTLSLEPGDLLAIDHAGAYGFSMSSNYNSRCRPAEVLVDGNQLHLIRQRETLEDLFAQEIMLASPE